MKYFYDNAAIILLMVIFFINLI